MVRESSSMPKSERADIVKELLLKKTIMESRANELLWAETFLSPGSHEDKVGYMLRSNERFLWLKEWCPADGRFAFEPFSRDQGSFGDITHERFLAAACFLSKSDTLAEAINHPFARLPIKEWRSLNNAAKTHAIGDAEDDETKSTFLQAIFMDLAVLKLGVQAAESPTTDALKVLQVPTEVFKMVVKTVVSHHKTNFRWARIHSP